MLFLMQSNVLFRLFRLLAVQIAFIPADIRLIFENCYNNLHGARRVFFFYGLQVLDFFGKLWLIETGENVLIAIFVLWAEKDGVGNADYLPRPYTHPGRTCGRHNLCHQTIRCSKTSRKP